MKKIITILVGIIIGSVSTLLIQQAKPRPKVSVAHEYNGGDFGGTKSTDFSTDNLNIFNPNEGILIVCPSKHPDMFVHFEMLDGENLTISLSDAKGAKASFSDKNSDGKWDFRDFLNDDVSYLYGRGTGYPDTIMSQNDLSVRIDGIYYTVEGDPEKLYIVRQGQRFLIEANKNGLGYFTIKSSEPIN